jgi:predicted deacylase
VHRVLAYLESHLDSLRGRVVMFPSLNPTGHLILSRNSQFDDSDPNRQWPDATPAAPRTWDDAAASDPAGAGDWLALVYSRGAAPKPIERCWTAVFELFRACRPDFHIDLHTMCALSIPFVFLDRVFFDDRGASAEQARASATSLFAHTRALCAAIGLSYAIDSTAIRYARREVHRSTSGAVLNLLGIPAVTMELGGNASVDASARDAGVQGVLNALAHAGCCPREVAAPIVSVPTPLASPAADETAPSSSPPQPLPPLYRCLDYPYVPCAGVVDIVRRAGDRFRWGDLLAVVRAVDGTERARICADFSGVVIAWRDGVTRYGGEALGVCAAEDRLPTVVAWADVTEALRKGRNDAACKCSCVVS